MSAADKGTPLVFPWVGRLHCSSAGMDGQRGASTAMLGSMGQAAGARRWGLVSVTALPRCPTSRPCVKISWASSRMSLQRDPLM